MSKREISMFAAQGVDVDAPRAKRQRTAAAVPGSSGAAAGGHTARANGGQAGAGEGAAHGEDQATVKEKGMKLWQTVKEATDKDGRVMSPVFMRLPTKKQYPDYYVQIKHPIALEDIKRGLERGQYATFDDVKQEFEQCFKNAKKYNMKESQIWLDAKHLHKLVIKEASKLSGKADDGEHEDGDGEGSDGDEGKKKKAPNMHRLLKTRLQKVADKADDTGRVLSAEFMDLPNKKQWPIYYKTIKNPQCLENIFRRLKRKEYHTALEFSNDVELVFSNALHFNQEHTQIWDDALVLRDYFRQLMSDLPSPFTIPAYTPATDQMVKIKLKVPGQTQSGAASTPRLKAPRAPATPQSAAMSTFTSVIAPFAAPRPIPATAVAPTPTASTSQAIPNAVSNLTQSPHPVAYNHSYTTPTFRATLTPSLLPNTNSIQSTRAAPQAAAVAPPIVTQLPPPQIQMPTIVPKSPTPPETGHQLRYVSITTQPLGRRLNLDYRDGVRVWSVRLGVDETSVRVEGVKFLGEDGDDHSDNEDRGRDTRREEEEEEEEEEEPQDKKRRGRQKKKRGKESPKGKGKAVVKTTVEPEVQVKLNGVLQNSMDGEEQIWDVAVPVGHNVVEVGEKGARIWRVYLERIAAN